MLAETTILTGDVRQTILGIPDGSIHCAVTSPPYYKLRAYLPKDHPDKFLEIGSEPTMAGHIQAMVEVARQVRRVLRDDGTFWFNYGDSFARNPKKGIKFESCDSTYVKNQQAIEENRGIASPLPDGNLSGIPWRIAFALVDDGWILRSAITWTKGVSFLPEWSGAVMPESVSGTRWVKCRVKLAPGKSPARNRRPELRRVGNGVDLPTVPSTFPEGAKWAPCPGCDKCRANDGWILRRGSWRPTSSYEMLFLFAKTPGYYADGEAVKENVSESMVAASQRPPRIDREYAHDSATRMGKRSGNRVFSDEEAMLRLVAAGRNLRNSWAIPTVPSHVEHYASFPEALVEPCIKVGTSEKGCCPACGAPWARMIKRKTIRRERPNDLTRRHLEGMGVNSCGNTVAGVETTTIDWKPTCPCPAHEPVPCRVLDPFGGAGTVGLVARKLGRHATLCELNAKYAAIARDRVDDYAPLFAAGAAPAVVGAAT